MPEESFLDKVKRMSAEEKEQVIKKIEEAADYNERVYGVCSQSVLAPLQEHFKLGDGGAFKASYPFAGGVLHGELCGALTGGVLAIGLAYGRDEFVARTLPLGMEDCWERILKLCARFRKEFGSLRCRDVQQVTFGRSWDLTNPAEREDFRRPEIHDTCGSIAGKTARMAAEVILEPI